MYIHDPERSDKGLKDLILAAGAKALSRPPPDVPAAASMTDHSLEADPHAVIIVAGKECNEQRPKTTRSWKGTCVNREWLIDSASNFCVQPFDRYLV